MSIQNQTIKTNKQILKTLENEGLEKALKMLAEDNSKELILFAVFCARQNAHLLTDWRSVYAINVTERYAYGITTKGELKNAANDAANAAYAATANDTANDTAYAAYATNAATNAAAYANDAANDAAYAAYAAATAAAAAANDAANAAAAKQKEYLIDRLTVFTKDILPNRETVLEFCASRTNKRIEDKVYQAVPSEFSIDSELDEQNGLHISTNDCTLLAYYPTIRHVLDDKPQQIRPGKYLKKYYPEVSDDVIRQKSALISGKLELKFYSKSDDMISIYQELADAGIVESCMSKSESDFKSSEHPLSVYDNSDVELAVLVDHEHKPLARALYNKNNKNYAMIYGQWEKLKVALDNAGFIHADLNGAKINAIDDDDHYGCLIMPYIDGHRQLDRHANNWTKFNYDGDTVTISNNGNFCADETEGYVRIEEEKEYTDCEECGDTVETDETYYFSLQQITVCECCRSNSVIMIRDHRSNEQVTESYAKQNCVEIDGYYYEDHEAAENAGYARSQYHDSWLDGYNAVYIEDMSDYLESDDENILYVMIYNTAYSVEYISKNISEFYYDVDTSEIVLGENIDTVELKTLRFLLDNVKPDNIPQKI